MTVRELIALLQGYDGDLIVEPCSALTVFRFDPSFFEVSDDGTTLILEMDEVS